MAVGLVPMGWVPTRLCELPMTCSAALRREPQLGDAQLRRSALSRTTCPADTHWLQASITRLMHGRSVVGEILRNLTRSTQGKELRASLRTEAERGNIKVLVSAMISDRRHGLPDGIDRADAGVTLIGRARLCAGSSRSHSRT